jgi:hypothetical protein
MISLLLPLVHVALQTYVHVRKNYSLYVEKVNLKKARGLDDCLPTPVLCTGHTSVLST